MSHCLQNALVTERVHTRPCGCWVRKRSAGERRGESEIERPRHCRCTLLHSLADATNLHVNQYMNGDYNGRTIPGYCLGAQHSSARSSSSVCWTACRVKECSRAILQASKNGNQTRVLLRQYSCISYFSCRLSNMPIEYISNKLAASGGCDTVHYRLGLRPSLFLPHILQV